MRHLAKLLFFNTLVALIVILISSSFLRDPRPERLLRSFVVSWVYATTIGSICWWVLPRVAPRIRGSALTRWLQLLLVLFAIGLGGGTLAFLLMVTQPFLRVRLEYLPSMAICIVITLLIGSISCVVEEARHRLQASTLELRTRELERERALKAASDARLQSLESRIHPHFLFNTLNSISSLVRSSPEQAEEMIERLAALLRFSLDRHGNMVSLADELKITRDYLEIEKARFGERLRYAFEVPEELLQAQVPALSLQTLAENSVKYAVGVQRNGAEIFIRARAKNQMIEFEVSDTGPGFSPDSLAAGHGLDTLKQRLDSLFGERATLTTRRLEPGMEVAFRIPC